MINLAIAVEVSQGGVTALLVDDDAVKEMVSTAARLKLGLGCATALSINFWQVEIP